MLDDLRRRTSFSCFELSLPTNESLIHHFINLPSLSLIIILVLRKILLQVLLQRIHPDQDVINHSLLNLEEYREELEALLRNTGIMLSDLDP